jgi:hypothetical protein
MSLARKSAFVGNTRLNAGGVSRSRKSRKARGNQLVPKNVTLAAAFDEYRKYSKAHHRSHKTFIEPLLKFWEREFAEDMPLAKITTSKIEQVKLRRVQEVSPATVDKSVAVLKAFFSWCDRQGIFNHNPVRTVKLFNPNNELIRYLSTEQLSASFVMVVCRRSCNLIFTSAFLSTFLHAVFNVTIAFARW